MLITEANLIHVEKLIKHVILVCITTKQDIVVNTNIFPQLINKDLLK